MGGIRQPPGHFKIQLSQGVDSTCVIEVKVSLKFSTERIEVLDTICIELTYMSFIIKQLSNGAWLDSVVKYFLLETRRNVSVLRYVFT